MILALTPIKQEIKRFINFDKVLYFESAVMKDNYANILYTRIIQVDQNIHFVSESCQEIINMLHTP